MGAQMISSATRCEPNRLLHGIHPAPQTLPLRTGLQCLKVLQSAQAPWFAKGSRVRWPGGW